MIIIVLTFQTQLTTQFHSRANLARPTMPQNCSSM